MKYLIPLHSRSLIVLIVLVGSLSIASTATGQQDLSQFWTVGDMWTGIENSPWNNEPTPRVWNITSVDDIRIEAGYSDCFDIFCTKVKYEIFYLDGLALNSRQAYSIDDFGTRYSYYTGQHRSVDFLNQPDGLYSGQITWDVRGYNHPFRDPNTLYDYFYSASINMSYSYEIRSISIQFQDREYEAVNVTITPLKFEVKEVYGDLDNLDEDDFPWTYSITYSQERDVRYQVYESPDSEYVDMHITKYDGSLLPTTEVYLRELGLLYQSRSYDMLNVFSIQIAYPRWNNVLVSESYYDTGYELIYESEVPDYYYYTYQLTSLNASNLDRLQEFVQYDRYAGWTSFLPFNVQSLVLLIIVPLLRRRQA